MLRDFFGNLIFAIIAPMLCGNHLNLCQYQYIITIILSMWRLVCQVAGWGEKDPISSLLFFSIILLLVTIFGFSTKYLVEIKT